MRTFLQLRKDFWFAIVLINVGPSEYEVRWTFNDRDDHFVAFDNQTKAINWFNDQVNGLIEVDYKVQDSEFPEAVYAWSYWRIAGNESVAEVTKKTAINRSYAPWNF